MVRSNRGRVTQRTVLKFLSSQAIREVVVLSETKRDLEAKINPKRT